MWQGRRPARDRHGRLGLRAHPALAGGSGEDAVGPLFCVLDGRTRGRAWVAGAAREALYLRAARAGVRRRSAPHQLRHAHAIELAREGVPLNIIQRQLEHQNLGATSVYLQGIDPGEIIETIHARPPPMIPASAGLDLRRR